MTYQTPPRRPAMWEPSYLQRVAGGIDPAAAFEASYESARLLVSPGKSAIEQAAHDRLIALIATEGIELLADLWSRAAPVSLPGALWRLQLLRDWIRCDAIDQLLTGRFAGDLAHKIDQAVDLLVAYASQARSEANFDTAALERTASELRAAAGQYRRGLLAGIEPKPNREREETQ